MTLHALPRLKEEQLVLILQLCEIPAIHSGTTILSCSVLHTNSIVVLISKHSYYSYLLSVGLLWVLLHPAIPQDGSWSWVCLTHTPQPQEDTAVYVVMFGILITKRW